MTTSFITELIGIKFLYDIDKNMFSEHSLQITNVNKSN